MNVLAAAETWGKAPWEIAGRDDARARVIWMYRWIEYRNQMAKKDNPCG